MWLGFFLYLFCNIPSLSTLFHIPRYSWALFLHMHFHYLWNLSPWPRPGLTPGSRCLAPWALKRLITWACGHYLRVAGGNVTVPCFCCFGSTSDPPRIVSVSLPLRSHVTASSFLPLNSPPSSVVGEAGPQLLHHAVCAFRPQTDTNDVNLGKCERQRFTVGWCYLSPFLSVKWLHSAHRYKK